MIIVKLNELLSAKNKTLYSLAKEAQISYPAIHSLSNGKTTAIAFDTLDKLCDALNCNTQDIIEHIKR